MATGKSMYMKYIQEEAISASVTVFSWDLKYVGVQVLLTRLHFEGGFIHMRDGANTQYAISTSFLFTVYSDLLAKYNQIVKCENKEFDSAHLLDFAKKQYDVATLRIIRFREIFISKFSKSNSHHHDNNIPQS
ncbi:endoglucanase, putative [Medicago truncatula]|uniref:Endoglucanase, putative n=1 Tax=Medicago truncatula TaxID=3880 RepID=A0A072VR39_MEDTR|nr:endoglucanase, putative [Medicago truncatula]